MKGSIANYTLRSKHSGFHCGQYLQLRADSGYTLANLKKILQKSTNFTNS